MDILKNRFAYHPATTQDRQDAHEDIRCEAYRLAAIIQNDIPDGREKSLALTKVEEAMFWANAAIARKADQ